MVQEGEEVDQLLAVVQVAVMDLEALVDQLAAAVLCEEQGWQLLLQVEEQAWVLMDQQHMPAGENCEQPRGNAATHQELQISSR